jgi:hypothetical protein
MSDTTTTTTVYKVTPQKLLIDLNGDLTNFDINFKATGESGKHFEALVVDQQTLDGSEPLVYKKVTDQLSANIISDNNTYQNFFLVLKSLEPCNVEVILTKKSIPAAPPVTEKYDDSNKMNIVSKFSRETIMILIIFLGIGAYFIWKNYIIDIGTTTSNMDNTMPISSEVSSPILPSFSKFGGVNSDLLSRLNNLSIN